MNKALRVLGAAWLVGTSAGVYAGVSVSLTNPPDGSTQTIVQVTAIATATQGYTVSKVEFFADSILIGTDTVPSSGSHYFAVWQNPATGPHVLTAKATATKNGSPNQTATSSPRSVAVNLTPQIALTGPPSGQYGRPATINATADASDSDGSITFVDFFMFDIELGDTTVSTASTPPYTATFTLDGGLGGYSLWAVAHDNQGGTKTSESVGITLVSNTPPSVSVSNPSPNAVFTAPANILLQAQANDLDGGVSQVEFYQGSTLVATVTSPPYSFSWSGVSAGTYSITARAYDVSGASTTSAPVGVTVNGGVATLHFVHVDHLNTPRLVADSTGTTVWRWDQQEPFGSNIPDENPSGFGVFDLPLRLPGQYFDKETNLHYNYFRNYDTATGGYVEADPLGVVTKWPRPHGAGLNHLYSYVGGSPLIATDPRGLVKWTGRGRSFAYGVYGRDEYELESECKCGTKVRILVTVDSVGPGKGGAATRDEAEFEDDFACPNPMAFAGPAFGFTATLAFRYGVSYSRVQIGRAVSSGWSAVEGLGASIGPSGGAADVEILRSESCCQRTTQPTDL